MSTDLSTQQNGMDLQQAQAIASLPKDVMMLKMENESIMSVARANPRNPTEIVGQLKELVEAYPAAAEKAIYRKPVGTVMRVTCGNRKCGIRYEVNKVEAETVCPACDSKERGEVKKVKKFAEGLSIRAAEDIRSIFGYTRLATTTEILDDGKVRLGGVLVDYAAGNLTSDERIVSPMYRDRFGKMVQTPEDRFLNVVVKAEKSKLRRDVILDNTPSIVKARYRDLCEEKMKELVTPEIIEQKILPAFAQYGITPAHLDEIIGRSHKLGWNEGERLELRKILTALKNEETTPQELLDDLVAKKSSAPRVQQSGVTMADLTTPPEAKPGTKSPAPQPESPAPQQQPQPDVEPESEAVSRWCEEVRGMEKLADLVRARKSIPREWSDAGKQKVVSVIEMREADLRGGQAGTGQSQGQMFDGGQ